jgi:hypothetical protein
MGGRNIGIFEDKTAGFGLAATSGEAAWQIAKNS